MPTPARIVHVAWLSHVGGGELFLLDLLRALERRGLEQELLCVGPGGELLEQVREIGIPARRFTKRTKLGLLTLLRLARALRRSRPDVVQTHGETGVFWGIPAALLARAPRLCALVYQNAPGPRHKMLVMRRLLSRADVVLAGSADVARFLTASLDVDAARVDVVHCGIDARRFLAAGGGVAASGAAGLPSPPTAQLPPDDPAPRQPSPPPGSIPAAAEGPLVVTVGRLVEQKGHAVLLEAFALLRESHPTVRLRIVGDGELRDDLVARARRLGVAGGVEFAGTVYPTLGVLRDADLFAFPSRVEPQGLAVLEAFAAGLPVVASRTGGIVEMVEEGVTGLLVEPGDAAALAAALGGLLDDPARGRALAAAARRRVEEFDVGRIARRYEALYEALLQGREAAARDDGSGVAAT